MNVVLVDDDFEMVHMLANLIDWQDLDFNIVCKSSTADTVLEQTQNVVIDLLVTDITMPRKNGFELTAELLGRNPEMQVIYLTCHDEFDFAQKAISIGVNDYIIKDTLTKEQLFKSLEHIKNNHIRRNLQQQAHSISPDFVENESQIKEHLLRKLIKDGDVQAFLHKLKSYGITCEERTFCLIGASIHDAESALAADNIQTSLQDSINSIAQIVQTYMQSCGCCDIVFQLQHMIIILHPQAKVQLSDKLYLNTIESLYIHLLTALNIQVAFFASDDFHSLKDIGLALQMLQKRHYNTFYLKHPIDLKQHDVPFAPLPSEFFDDFVEQFRISILDKKSFEYDMMQLMKRIEKHVYDPQQVLRLMQLFVSSIYQQTIRYGKMIPELRVTDMSFAFCKQVLNTQFQLLLGKKEESLSKQENRDIQNVIRYIDEHLSQDLSLKIVSEKVYKNSSYLSRLFKQNMGESFSEYLTKRRISRATYFLRETQLPIEEIGAQIGIQNPSYFFRYYKRETGKTPGSVRNNE